VVIAAMLFWLEKQRKLSTDILLGILSHSALALGLLVLSVIQSNGYGINVYAYLFGDLLAVNATDIVLMSVGAVIILIIFSRILPALSSISVNGELARSDNVPVEKVRFVFMVLLALVIAVALKVVGVLLITALLIIPAATARLFSRSPQQMVWVSTLIAILAVLLGLFSSFNWDFPAGPAIVMSASLMFFVSRLFSR